MQEGWDGLNAVVTDVRDAKQAREDLAKLCHRVLEATEDGKKLMGWLVKNYVDQPIAIPGTDPSHAYYAEGCRSVVRDLVARVQMAKEIK